MSTKAAARGEAAASWSGSICAAPIGRDERRMQHFKTSHPTKAPKKVDEYILRLYVAGTSSRSRQAILRTRELCAGELKGRCTLEVIDIYQDPIRARDEQIVATPTLVKVLPRPERRLIGAVAKSSRLCVGLGLETLSK